MTVAILHHLDGVMPLSFITGKDQDLALAFISCLRQVFFGAEQEGAWGGAL